MKTFTSIAVTALFAGSALAIMIPNVQYVNLDLHNLDKFESFHFQIWADGKRYLVNNPMPVAAIDDPDYSAFEYCHFETAQPKNVTFHMENFGTANASQQVLIQPPQPIISITCQGVCVAHKAPCSASHKRSNEPCCNGVCYGGVCQHWGYPKSD
ncbi:hypothetical protein PT974_04551 [Cladobotryum mycophilum]|uniref:Uncharacterized protein n=1 Tax=Cladobotryum mycophilum TaxID=491253 RepID=A0ABR0SVG8_9HYPO